ncbi:MarR family transcriptional regulator [Polynucleobacter sp. MWH-Loch1C5]|uniref:MarR family winged helix-turn-helix transcriptional regulator n=1 Tax=Polynucleobacter sp. MWH-Loch1C5 TaxID=2689108 RepID=UPI001C0D7737|nr:MarR family transcriptional regulator [Polynucleobacter sp. MWH-Loch1C5]MBU3541929.1 MarR family transcriptional regulator [Polynucleobacter sp. MWH-Loch1C5]
MTFLPLIKDLATTYQAFERYSARHIKSMGLTETQFDILATLGNQPPMTCKELGEKTLILKGTMTGVLERMETKGLIERLVNEEDARSYRVQLTKAGDRLFKRVFPEHIEYLSKAFNQLSKEELEKVRKSLTLIKSVLN